MIDIRAVVKADIEDLKVVLNSIELFPAEMLEDMIADYLNNSESQDIQLTACIDNKPIAIAYCTPEKLTEGKHNLFAIGIINDIQGKDIGSLMMNHLEDGLKNLGARILIGDNSGTDQFKAARNFYKKLNYTQVATIKDCFGRRRR